MAVHCLVARKGLFVEIKEPFAIALRHVPQSLWEDCKGDVLDQELVLLFQQAIERFPHRGCLFYLSLLIKARDAKDQRRDFSARSFRHRSKKDARPRTR